MKICTNYYEDSRGNEVEKSTLTGTNEGMNIVAGAWIWTDMDSPLKPVARGCVSTHANCKENLLAREMCFCWFFRLSSHGGERAKTCGSRHLRGYFLAVGGKKNLPEKFFLALFLQAQRKWLTGVLSCATSGFAILIQYSSCSQYRFSNNCWDDTDELHCSGSASQTIPTIIHPKKNLFRASKVFFFGFGISKCAM